MKCVGMFISMLVSLTYVAANAQHFEEFAPSPGDTIVIQGITMVSIPGGSFMMGSEDGAEWEKPVHQVSISGFWMSETEITNAQYAAYLNSILPTGEITARISSVTEASDNFRGQEYIYQEYIYLAGSTRRFGLPGNECWINYNGVSFSVESGKENWPVVFVTWYGAKVFALKYGMDLPTDAEWEYAARGGMQYEYGTNDGTISCENANYKDCSNIRHPVDVGSYPANPFGLRDMTGNVQELCNDWYEGDYSSESVIYTKGPETGPGHVKRGGGWLDDAYTCRSSYRNGCPAYGRYATLGFRVVRR